VSTSLRVDCTPTGDGWLCSVAVTDGGGTSRHEVTVRPEELSAFAPGAGEPTALVEESFRFLLEREPKESILRRFAISEIGRYFPEYRVEIATRLTGAG
jgi:hypothetical protein